ncbi:MAG: hypothetical protein SFV54_19750 [Bryobacteraceae bacterium]|nr:hypothetical protein [Bryobacteraceae bacterium]
MIRNEQKSVFAAEKLRQFEARIATKLRREYPKRFGDSTSEEMAGFYTAVMARASEWRINGEGATTVLFELCAEYGLRFERAPDAAWAETILAHPQLPDHIRVSVVRDRFWGRQQGREIVEEQPLA